jgi:hypothetical protein
MPYIIKKKKESLITKIKKKMENNKKITKNKTKINKTKITNNSTNSSNNNSNDSSNISIKNDTNRSNGITSLR